MIDNKGTLVKVEKSIRIIAEDEGVDALRRVCLVARHYLETVDYVGGMYTTDETYRIKEFIRQFLDLIGYED